MIETNSLHTPAKFRLRPDEPCIVEVQDGPRAHWRFHSAWATPEWAAHMRTRFADSHAQDAPTTQEAERANAG